MTETLTLALAFSEALPAAVTQAMAFPLALPMSLATAPALLAKLPAADTSCGPCTWTASMIAGMFVCTVATSAVMLALAIALHCRVTVGGVHMAVRFAWPEHEPWHCALVVHMAGLMVPSHLGAVTATLQPPLQLAIAPQLTPPDAVTLQLPLHDPAQVPLQWAGVPGVIMQAASHLPLQVPVHIPVLGIPVPPIAVQVPLQLPMQLPLHSIEPPVGGVHMPVQSASQEPVHCAWTVADPRRWRSPCTSRCSSR